MRTLINKLSGLFLNASNDSIYTAAKIFLLLVFVAMLWAAFS
jgi:hypothetical protein